MSEVWVFFWGGPFMHLQVDTHTSVCTPQQTSCVSYRDGTEYMWMHVCVCVDAGIWNLTMTWLDGQALGTASGPGEAACTTTIHINRIRQLIKKTLWYRLLCLGCPGAWLIEGHAGELWQCHSQIWPGTSNSSIFLFLAFRGVVTDILWSNVSVLNKENK